MLTVCGQIGHTKTNCVEQPLENWEQTYLKEFLWLPMNANYAGHTLPDVMLHCRDINNCQWVNRPTNDHIRLVSEEWRGPYSGEKSDLKKKNINQGTGEIHR